MMNGNEAIAFGAISAGLKFVSFYPMTPSTSIALNLAAQAKKMGLVVEQAEDEIAAINMAIGASFAGAPSMVPTSGGGFALMVEGVSLSAMTETPVVIVVAQRPGPATGLPTRTEQGDLELILHAGHGEFPRAIFAPGTVEECFHLTRKAFALAERYQGPMFLLTDQFLADSYRAVMPFDTRNLPAVSVGTRATGESSYERFTLTESGVSPRRLPGTGKHLVVADSDEHTERGHITEDLSVRIKMVGKRLAKGQWISSEVIPPEAHGEEKPDLLLL
jgi:2-oxoglutarate ferredoxin oxidoreductase subunit alpha